MRSLTLITMICVIGLAGCANKQPPLAFCPSPPVPSPDMVERALNNDVEGQANFFFNSYRKHLCKYWQAYDFEQYENMCVEEE